MPPSTEETSVVYTLHPLNGNAPNSHFFFFPYFSYFQKIRLTLHWDRNQVTEKQRYHSWAHDPSVFVSLVLLSEPDEGQWQPMPQHWVSQVPDGTSGWGTEAGGNQGKPCCVCSELRKPPVFACCSHSEWAVCHPPLSVCICLYRSPLFHMSNMPLFHQIVFYS